MNAVEVATAAADGAQAAAKDAADAAARARRLFLFPQKAAGAGSREVADQGDATDVSGEEAGEQEAGRKRVSSEEDCLGALAC